MNRDYGLDVNDPCMNLTAIMNEASLRTMMASFKGSWRQVASGIRCFAAFADEHRPGTPHLPASEQDILAWSSFFQSGGTFSNYLGHLHAAHTLCRMQPQWNSEILRRLRSGHRKLTVQLVKPSIRSKPKDLMVRDALEQGDLECAAAFSLCYDRLFRFQSELYPLEMRSNIPPEPLTSVWHSALVFEHDLDSRRERPLKGHIHLRRRKNSELPCVLSTDCACASEASVPCALCLLWRVWKVASDLKRKRLFSLSKASFMTKLKHYASRAGLAVVSRLGFHAFRRGRCQDLVNAREPLHLILKMGGWRSSAVLSYMALDDLDNRVHALKASEDSDSEADR